MAEGDLDTFDICALLKRSRFCIANDSDVLHLALSAGCPTLGIIGPLDYQLYANYGPEADLTAFYRPIDCRPCVNEACSDPVCIRSISVETILEAATAKIEELQGLCRIAVRPTS
jgi:ADP-heptose:LPS heptosyltransferase